MLAVLISDWDRQLTNAVTPFCNQHSKDYRIKLVIFSRFSKDLSLKRKICKLLQIPFERVHVPNISMEKHQQEILDALSPTRLVNMTKWAVSGKFWYTCNYRHF